MRLKACLVVWIALLCSMPAWGDPIFESPTLIGVPGDTLTFRGSLENTWGYDVFITGATITLVGFAPEDSDLTPFILNAPLTLANTASTSVFDWFTVTIPAGFSPGTYDGFFVVQGGAEEGADGTLGSAAFAARYDSTVPEPGSFWLMAGAAALCWAFRRANLNRQAAR